VSQLDALLDAIGAAPVLPGAKCRHRSHLFDEARRDEAPETVDQRHAQALMLCRDCPALASCQQWFTSLKPSQKPPGVVAGRIHTPKQPKAGRPRKTAV
jgi:hypothetical protein